MRDDYHSRKTLSIESWIEVLHDEDITRRINISILQTMYSFEGHKASASQIGMILFAGTGRKAAAPINSLIGHWGKRLVKKYPLKLTKRENGTESKWDLFFDGWTDKNANLFIWKLKDELIEALKQSRLTGEDRFAEEIQNEEFYNLTEGIKKTIQVNAYERNSKARSKCIEYWKPICSVCAFDFEKCYGILGKGFIHVHHLVPMSEIGQNYQVDPINDLRPVCPNCHAMLHRKNPPLTIEVLRQHLTT